MFSANTSQVSNDVKYIEDFFSAWLRTGTGSSQTVTTGIKENTGALVISKSRSAATDWAWYDTFRGATKDLASNTSAAETTQSQGLTAFNTDGHTWGTLAKVNTSGATYVDFVLKPTPKFFDVVTFTTDSSGVGTFSHSLGATPGCVLIKKTSGAEQWYVWHRSLTTTSTQRYLGLNTTAAETNVGFDWISVSSTSCSINGLFGTNSQYVAYLFAHNAGGFGLTGTDNVISCGSFTTDAGGSATVTLNYEPQWLIIKRSDSTGAWYMWDIMRGLPVTASSSNRLSANTSAAEVTGAESIYPTATGFTESGQLNTNATYIYIAIRRGPMKVPTDGTKVFSPATMTGTGSARNVASGFVVDSIWNKTRGTSGLVGYTWGFVDRLRGKKALDSTQTSGEVSWTSTTADVTQMGNTTVSYGTPSATNINYASDTQINWFLQRAPGFFDEVCYTGNGAASRAVPHNLTVAPELMLVKARNLSQDWYVYNGAKPTFYLTLNTTNSESNGFNIWGGTATATNFYVNNVGSTVNDSGYNFVAYLFATCPGVSKVGSYTGNGSTQTINCGFTAGARFVLIKRTDSTGDWYVWDSARGIVTGNDPYLLLNSTAAEVTTTDYIDPYSAGFEISSTAPAAINASGGSFIYLAIA